MESSYDVRSLVSNIPKLGVKLITKKHRHNDLVSMRMVIKISNSSLNPVKTN